MKRLLLILSFLVLVTSMSSQSWALLACQGHQDNYRDNCRGNYKFSNGDYYEGEWQNNKINGQGIYKYVNGNQYIGKYKNNKRNGHGAFTWVKPSEKYVGEWKNDKRNGQGTNTYASGKKEEGIWKDDKFIYVNKLNLILNSKIDEYNIFCSEIGLKKGTNKFNECLSLYRKKISPNSSSNLTKELKLDKNKIFCKKIGLINGSDKFKECLYVYNNKISPNANSNDIDNSKSINDQVIFSGSGTGFAVASKGYIVTNYHVIKYCDNVKIHNKDKIIPATIIKIDSKNDIALIKGNFTSRGILPFSNKETKLLQEIYVAGYPFGNKFSSSVKVTKGIISSLTGIGNNFSNIQIDAAIQPGNSGGPILNNKGNVIGVVVAKLNQKYIQKSFGVIPENINFGIKIRLVKNFLESENIELTYPNKNEILIAKLGQNISNSTYYLSCWKTRI